jgi:hypothetical protein
MPAREMPAIMTTPSSSNSRIPRTGTAGSDGRPGRGRRLRQRRSGRWGRSSRWSGRPGWDAARVSSSRTPCRVRGAVRRRVFTLEMADLEIQHLLVLILRTVGCEWVCARRRACLRSLSARADAVATVSCTLFPVRRGVRRTTCRHRLHPTAPAEQCVRRHNAGTGDRLPHQQRPKSMRVRASSMSAGTRRAEAPSLTRTFSWAADRRASRASARDAAAAEC